MTDKDALLRAVAANPDEDTPRLIFADLLDELGGEANAARARFIRLQIDTHRGPGDTGGTSAFERKTAEVEELAARFARDWLRELPEWCDPLSAPLGKVPADLFSRGFVERVRLKAKHLALHFAELDTLPLRSLEVLGGSTELLPKVFALPVLARLKSMAIRWGGAGDALAEAIAASRQLSDLYELDLSRCSISERAARVLSRTEGLPKLHILRLRNVGHAALASLAASAKLAKLREIDIRGSGVWYGSIATLRLRFPNKWFRD